MYVAAKRTGKYLAFAQNFMIYGLFIFLVFKCTVQQFSQLPAKKYRDHKLMPTKNNAGNINE